MQLEQLGQFSFLVFFGFWSIFFYLLFYLNSSIELLSFTCYCLSFDVTHSMFNLFCAFYKNILQSFRPKNLSLAFQGAKNEFSRNNASSIQYLRYTVHICTSDIFWQSGLLCPHVLHEKLHKKLILCSFRPFPMHFYV